MQQPDQPGLPFDQRSDHRALLATDYQIAFRNTVRGPRGPGVVLRLHPVPAVPHSVTFGETRMAAIRPASTRACRGRRRVPSRSVRGSITAGGVGAVKSVLLLDL